MAIKLKVSLLDWWSIFSLSSSNLSSFSSYDPCMPHARNTHNGLDCCYLLNRPCFLLKNPQFSSGITLHSSRGWIMVDSFSFCQEGGCVTKLWPINIEKLCLEHLEIDVSSDKRETYRQWFLHPLPFALSWNEHLVSEITPAILWPWANTGNKSL